MAKGINRGRMNLQSCKVVVCLAGCISVLDYKTDLQRVVASFIRAMQAANHWAVIIFSAPFPRAGDNDRLVCRLYATGRTISRRDNVLYQEIQPAKKYQDMKVTVKYD